jgi:hypothetical protein
MQSSSQGATGQTSARAVISGPIVWALVGLVLYVLAGMASLIVAVFAAEALLTALGFRVEPGTFAWSVRNATHPLVWGPAVAGLSLPIGRRLVPGLAVRPTGWALLVAGLVLAAGTELLVEEFVRERFGYYEADSIGWTVFTSPALVAVALSAWATRCVPAGHGVSLAVLTATAGMALFASLAPSLAGLADGIDPSSVPLVVVLGGGVAYASLAVVSALRHGLGVRPHG